MYQNIKAKCPKCEKLHISALACSGTTPNVEYTGPASTPRIMCAVCRQDELQQRGRLYERPGAKPNPECFSRRGLTLEEIRAYSKSLSIMECLDIREKNKC